jgi:mannose-6-phosphate isomerase-like protein (cupin superfamily)
MKASWREAIARIPGPVTSKWPQGEPVTEVIRHGSMIVKIFAPRGKDYQTPHDQDELYLVKSGSALFVRDKSSETVETGDVLFVPARALHHFEQMSSDFFTWVVFWGPVGGEQERID